MRVRLVFLGVILMVAAFCFSGTARAQYRYYCETPDGSHYWANNPCDYKGYRNEDYNKGYPYNFHQKDFHGSPLNKDSEGDAQAGAHSGGTGSSHGGGN
jgi:hypothetical protein